MVSLTWSDPYIGGGNGHCATGGKAEQGPGTPGLSQISLTKQNYQELQDISADSNTQSQPCEHAHDTQLRAFSLGIRGWG